jgi:hypothetical protein
MTQAKWQKLLQAALETEEIEIGCMECEDVLDMYADLLLEKGNAAEVMPAVEQHLKQCGCCASELEALMIMLDKAIVQEKSLSS